VEKNPKNKPNDPEKAFWLKTLEVSEQCLDLDRRFLGTLERKTAQGHDPLDPALWENFIEARRNLVEYTTENLNLLARDRKAIGRNRDIKDRLETTLGEVMQLEEKLTTFLSENLSVLKETIEDISRNQMIFTAYARHTHKPRPEVMETTA
jgi:predicted nuclease with TOPRIM domain